MYRPAAIVGAGFALSVVAGAACAAGSAVAATAHGDRCAAAPHAQFLSEAELTARVERFGYRVEHIGTVAGCYAVLGVDRRGKRYDMRFEAASLRMVSRHFARSAADVLARN